MEEIEKIRKEPYKYIPQWMESTLIHVGKPVFEILSLLPASLILLGGRVKRFLPRFEFACPRVVSGGTVS